MRDRGHIFDQLHIQAGCLERSDRAFASGAWTFDTNFDVSHAKFRCFLRCLLGSTLACERRALATSFEAASTSTGPAKRVAFWVSDGHGCVVERRVNVSDAVGDIAANTFLFV